MSALPDRHKSSAVLFVIANAAVLLRCDLSEENHSKNQQNSVRIG